MKAMLEARMVAVRIQGLADSLHGASGGADRLTVSQGVLIVTRDVTPTVQELSIVLPAPYSTRMTAI